MDGNREPGIRILHLEDDANDAELIHAALEADGLCATVRTVSTRDDFVAALESERFDLILSDYALPGFDGGGALRLALEKQPEAPFIMVSGQLGEEAAVESVKSGATDYVLKQRLSRLVPSVRRALAETYERAKRREAEDALRKSEMQLRHAQKMEAIGRLAAGVAHDFNNLLTAIMGHTQLMKRRLPPDHQAMRDAEGVLGAAERAASLTRQLLIFSRQEVPKPRVLDLNAVVADLNRMLRRLIGVDIDLVTVPASELGRIKADPGQVEQVLVNLVVNARDAMPDGGRLTIGTANVELGEDDVRDRPLVKPGRYVMLSVTDTGCGMGPEIQAQIFEPFFTTKEVGKGTGLGLATVHGIVQQGGGHVEVRSDVGAGSTFSVHLPRVDEAATPVAASAQAPPTQGSETVLLVEDEVRVRSVVAEVLRGHGYTVLEAGEPGEAISRAHGHKTRLDLFLIDVTLPKMSGPELARRIATLHPEARILFMSAQSPDGVQQGMMESAGFLPKPFLAEGLLRAVRAVLDGGSQKAA